MLANTQRNWGSLTKFFHWLIVMMVLVQVPAGYLMSYTYGLALHDAAVQPLQTLMSQIHHTLGLLILLLLPARLAWRLCGPVPGFDAHEPTYRHILARLTHALFYALLLVLPLSGWAAVSVVAGAPIWLFGAQMPPILPPMEPDSPVGYALYAHVHIYAAWFGGVLLMLHVGAAFWHHVVLKDGVFRRMWPLAKADERSTAGQEG
jgi:cytochrome b561